MTEINLDEWRWLRVISGLFTDTVDHYKELARKNEVLMVKIHNRDAYNIYVPETFDAKISEDGLTVDLTPKNESKTPPNEIEKE